jgi:hypothetical protein
VTFGDTAGLSLRKTVLLLSVILSTRGANRIGEGGLRESLTVWNVSQSYSLVVGDDALSETKKKGIPIGTPLFAIISFES